MPAKARRLSVVFATLSTPTQASLQHRSARWCQYCYHHRNPLIIRPASAGFLLQYTHVQRRTAPPPADVPDPAVRGLDRHPVDGRAPWLRPVAAADDLRQQLDARAFLARHGDPEPDLGLYRHLRRHAGRPFRRLQGAGGLCAVLRAGPGRHGLLAHPHPARPHLRRADRPCPGRHHLCRDLRRDRPQHRPREALLGHGHCGGRRLLRPVPDAAAGGLDDQHPRLAAGAGVAEPGHAADHSSRHRPARAGFPWQCRAQTRPEHRRSHAGSAALP